MKLYVGKNRLKKKNFSSFDDDDVKERRSNHYLHTGKIL